MPKECVTCGQQLHRFDQTNTCDLCYIENMYECEHPRASISDHTHGLCTECPDCDAVIWAESIDDDYYRDTGEIIVLEWVLEREM